MNVLMLSGEKDSCALAVMLKEKGEDFMALTIDNGFVRDLAIHNARAVAKHIDIQHVILRTPRKMYQEVEDAKCKGMLEACTKCSSLSITCGVSFSKSVGAKKLYAGFTKYTALACGWDTTPEKDIGGIILSNPFYADYPLPRIREIMDSLGLVLDPTKTNCSILPDLLKETNRQKLPNHLLTEVELLCEDGLISLKEKKYYRKFLCQK